VETPRGPATLWISVEEGEVSEAELIVPAQAALALAANVAEGRELGDALVGVASLDISPWGAG
jgi:Ni,Fe-hydrogenase III large subunit